MIYNYRCSHRYCRKRITLRHPLEWYIREPKCGACGRKQLVFDPEVRRRHLAETCRCMGIHFPHRRGTVLNARELCLEIPEDRLDLMMLRRDGIEPDGPASYLFGVDEAEPLSLIDYE